MQMGGYPWEPDDLTQEEWIDLGRLNEALAPPPAACPLLTRQGR